MTSPVLTSLRVFSTARGKLRIGRSHDGGYIVAQGLDYDHFLSGGISGDVSFEHHFLRLHPNLTCDAYDHSIPQLPAPHPRMVFHKQMIGPQGDTLAGYLDKHKSVFVKMDIEGGEFAWLDGLTDQQMNSIAQLVIEVHWVTKPEQWATLARLARTHYLVHVHGNNFSGVANVAGVVIPQVFECTYIRRDLEPELKLNQEPVPTPLDMPNNRRAPDIALGWPPFVNAPPSAGDDERVS